MVLHLEQIGQSGEEIVASLQLHVCLKTNSALQITHLNTVFHPQSCPGTPQFSGEKEKGVLCSLLPNILSSALFQLHKLFPIVNSKSLSKEHFRNTYYVIFLLLQQQQQYIYAHHTYIYEHVYPCMYTYAHISM